VLARLLTGQFGELPKEIQRRIETADMDTLLQWSDAVLTAETLEDVFR